MCGGCKRKGQPEKTEGVFPGGLFEPISTLDPVMEDVEAVITYATTSSIIPSTALIAALGLDA
jgi:hypothetical protein